MPTYEYACRACGHRFDAVQAMSEPPLTECPECGGDLRKVFHPAGIAFKGSGFYATDSRSTKKDGASTKPEKKTDKKETPAKEPAAAGSKKEAGGSTGSGSSSKAAD